MFRGAFKKYIFAICLMMPGWASVQAERGGLIEYELLEEFGTDEVTGFMTEVFSGFIDPEEQPEFFQLATAFFGQLIDQREVSIYKVIYETVDFEGATVPASGIVLIPDHAEYDCRKSFSLYAHGTVFARQAVNSRPQNWGGEFMLTLMMSAINTITVAPDYYGLGDGPGFHHHSHYQTNATSCLDAVRAGRNLCDLLGVEYNNRLLPMGYSEGGHASMSIAYMVKQEGLQDEFNIPFIGAGSGAYDMSGEAFDFILGNPYYPTRQYILYQVASCEDMYGDLLLEEEGESPSTYLRTPYDQLYIDHVLGQTGNMGWVPSYWRDMFQPGVIEEVYNDPQHPLRECLRKSNVYNWHNLTPTFMYYCTTDEQVPYTAALKTRDVQRGLIPWYQFWLRFRIQALDLTFGETIPDHATCALPSIFLQLVVMESNLGLSCSYTGREHSRALRSTDGRFIGQRFLYTDQTADLNNARLRQAGVKSVRGYNMLTGNGFNSDLDLSFTFSENGLYLVEEQRLDGSVVFDWVFRQAPDFVPTDDYNPVKNADGHSMLDLSLLPDEAVSVSVYGSNGSEYQRLAEPGREARIEWLPEMKDGDYMIIVRTAERNYPLKMRVDRRASEEGVLSVYPNPVVGEAVVRIPGCAARAMTATVYQSHGAALSEKSVEAGACEVHIPVKELPAGLYYIELNAPGTAAQRAEFIRP